MLILVKGATTIIRTYWIGKMGNALAISWISIRILQMNAFCYCSLRVPYSFFLMAGVLAFFAIPGILLVRCTSI